MTTFLQVKNNIANYPRTNPRGFLIVSRINSGYINQAYWDTRTSEVFTRSLLSSGWSDWTLASAQNALTPISGSQSDLNTIVVPCTALTDRNAANVPEANKYGYLTCLKFQTYISQIWMDMGMTRVYVRSANSASGWSGSTWRILVQNITSDAPAKNLTASDDMDNVVEPGSYGVQNTPLNSPINYGILEVVTSQLYDIQRAIRASDKAVYIRMKGHSLANYSGIEFTKVF